MDRTVSRFDAETLLPTSTQTTRNARRGKRSKAGLARADRARRVEFETLAASMRDELAPSGVLESIFVERAVVSAWRMREAIAAERAGILGGLTIGGASTDVFGRLADDLRRETDRAERSLRRSLDSLRDLRAASRPAWGKATFEPAVVAPIEGEDETANRDDELISNEWPVLPVEALDLEPPAPPDDSPLPRWQDRLVFDFNVSDETPVVRGTWITVAQIVTLIIDGHTWADILRSHPELIEEDIRVCLSYATEQENDGSRGNYLP